MSTTPNNHTAGSPQAQTNEGDNPPPPSEILAAAVIIEWLRSRQEKPKWTEKWTVFLTVLIAVAAFWSAWVFQGQLTVATKQAEAASADARSSRRHAREQLSIAQQQVKTSQDNITAIQEQMRQDQRAWVGMAPFQVNPDFTDKKLDFTFAFTNTGKSPAIDVIPCSEASIIPTQSWKEAYDLAFNPLVIENCISHAGPSTLMPSGLGVIRHIFISKPDESVAIAQNRALVYVHGWIKYKDIFKKPHEVTFCTLVGTNLPDPNAPQIRGNCVNGNEILY
jgi:hypothetical protein